MYLHVFVCICMHVYAQAQCLFFLLSFGPSLSLSLHDDMARLKVLST